MPTTTELLPTLNADVLKALARQLALPKTLTRKPELIEELDRYVRENLSNLLAHCSLTEKQLLAEAAYNLGQVDPAAFRAKYGKACPLPENPAWGNTKTLLLLLLDYQDGEWKMPPSISERLRALLEKPALVAIQVVENLPTEYTPPQEHWRKPAVRPIHVHEGERIVFGELRSVLKLVQAGKLKVTDKGGRPTEDTVRLISEVLVVPDFLVDPPPEGTDRYSEHAGAIRAHAWGVLVQQCDWAKAKSGRLALTSEGQKLLASLEVSEFAAGVEAFLWDDEFDELNRINHIRGQTGMGRRYLTAPGERRSEISESVAQWPVNQWVAFDEAVRFLLATGHRFEVTNADHTLYFSEFQYGLLGGQGSQINRQYLRAFLFEYLATLGLIDIAYVYPHHLWPELGHSWGIDEMSFCSRYDGLLYVRLNALGAYCLDATDVYQPVVPAEPHGWRVLPNREIVLVDGQQPSPADRHMLALFATQKSEHLWELDPARILNHLESGGKVEDALQFLEGNCAPPLPETVRTMLSDLARRGTVVRGVEEALLIEVEDETTAALIAHDSQAGKYCWLAGDRRLAVPKRNSRAFRSAMKKLGFIIPDGQFPT
jgi:hypothetical protein